MQQLVGGLWQWGSCLQTPAELCARAEVWPHLCVPVPTATTTSSRVSHQPNPSPVLLSISSKKKKRVYFSNPPIGDLSLIQEYLHVWNMCLEQFCAVLSFWSHAHGDAPEALAAAGWDVPSLAVCSDLPLPSKNVSPVFEDQAFKTGI